MKALLVTALLLASATTTTVPGGANVGTAHGAALPGEDYRPIVLVHGGYGSRLRREDGKREVWPGPLAKFFFRRFEPLALEIDPHSLRPAETDLEPYELIEGYGGVHLLDQVWRVLENAGGYLPAFPGERYGPEERRYYVFLYDWRQDFVEGAAKLDAFIEQIRRDYDDPALKVDVVAYSLGGLLARYFVRYGGQDVLDSERFHPNNLGAAKVRRLILIGTPNLGAVSAVQVFKDGRRFGLTRIQTEVFATMPGAYQVLPHPDRQWALTPDGRRAHVDLYSARTWREFRWSIYHPKARKRIRARFASDAEAERYIDLLERFFAKSLRRAERFHRALSAPSLPTEVSYIVLGADCRSTPGRYFLEPEKDGVELRLRSKQARVANGIDERKLTLAPGDGRVTRFSALGALATPSAQVEGSVAFPLAYSAFVCAEGHRHLTGSVAFERHLTLTLSLSLEGRGKGEAVNGKAVTVNGEGSEKTVSREAVTVKR